MAKYLIDWVLQKFSNTQVKNLSETSITEEVPVNFQEEYSQEEAYRNYFNDNKRQIDFILVCDAAALSSVIHRAYISAFINSLEKNGLELETAIGTVFDNLLFIKVHGPYNVLLRYASAFRMKLTFRALEGQKAPKVPFRFMATDLTWPDPDSPVFQRAKETISGDRPTQITATERIVLVDMLLSRAPFGDDVGEYGLAKLLKNKTFTAAYPLHVGPYEWTEKGRLNDRQLLARYWARLPLWYKQQPLNVIEKYYGPEVAFYFAFCGFYNKMLIPASIIGIICFVLGFVAALETDKNPITEICNSDQPLCPVFLKQRRWKPKLLREYCLYTKLNYLFDNSATVFFAFFMAFWATIFIELWKREHAALMHRWNLYSKDSDLRWRREFEDKTKYRRVCPITGSIEPYVPTWINIVTYSVTFVTCSFLITIVLLAVLTSILYRLMFSQIVTFASLALVNMAIAATISVLFIKIFGRWYYKISFWLTTLENPRTQAEFDDSYTYKLFLLSFTNNYAAMSYMAFIKGKLYTYPSDLGESLFITIMRGDLCHPAGCIMGLCIQLAFIMLLKSLIGNVLTLFVPNIRHFYGHYTHKRDPVPATSPQWEVDYDLHETSHYFLVGEYLEMVMQYGFVTFFVAAFPLAPLCAFINNMIELRTDASKFVRYRRRPVSVQIQGLKAWNGILQAMTFISIVTNGFVIAFTSDFVKREIYRHQTDSTLKGYINSTLSTFSTNDFKEQNRRMLAGNNTCYYRGNRYPPDHPNKYQLTSSFWFELSMRFVVAIIFEHIILLLTGILAYAIPDMPYDIKKNIKHQRNKRKQERIKAVDELGGGKRNQQRQHLVLPEVL